MNPADRLPIGTGVGPYVRPLDRVVVFRCACGRYVAAVSYRYPDMVTWLVSRSDIYYCDGCGQRLSGPMGTHWWLTDMVRWARDKSRAVRFLGLKEFEAQQAAEARSDESAGRKSYYRPTPPEFLEGGH